MCSIKSHPGFDDYNNMICCVFRISIRDMAGTQENTYIATATLTGPSCQVALRPGTLHGSGDRASKSRDSGTYQEIADTDDVYDEIDDVLVCKPGPLRFTKPPRSNSYDVDPSQGGLPSYPSSCALLEENSSNEEVDYLCPQTQRNGDLASGSSQRGPISFSRNR